VREGRNFGGERGMERDTCTAPRVPTLKPIVFARGRKGWREEEGETRGEGGREREEGLP
jgi:hypothetical protein